jgi:DNA-binding NtrC family response regulator
MAENKKKILIIDDSQSSRFLYKTVLASTSDYSVFLCSGLKEGLKRFYEVQPQLIVLDMELPDGSGVDFLKDIRSHGQSTKVIVISAVRSSDTIVESAKLGIGSYLIKPVDINLFMKKVKEMMSEEPV